MTSQAGVLRSGELLAQARDTLDRWAAVVRPDTVSACTHTRLHEDRNLLLAAQFLVAAAQQRTESLGAHYRSDCPRDASGIRENLDTTYPNRPKVSVLHD